MLSMVSRQCVYAVSSVHRRYRLSLEPYSRVLYCLWCLVSIDSIDCVYVGYRALIKGTVLSIVSSVYRHSIDSVYAVYSMTCLCCL